MSVQMEDKSGSMRPSRDYEDALRVVSKRFVEMKWMDDPEMMINCTTIIEALKIAIVLAKHEENKRQA